MSLVTIIRDYVANSSEQLDGSTFSSLSSLAYHTLTFLFTVAKQALVYCLTFHWLRDFSYFYFTPPSLASSFTLGETSLATLMGVEDQPLSHLLAFSDLDFTQDMKNLVGAKDSIFSTSIIGIVFLAFLNGGFSCIHLSAAHLITIRRMLVQGTPAGLCSAIGTAVGQLFFLTCVIFGYRGLLLPWLALEPLQFLLAMAITLGVASAMAQDRRRSTIQWSAKSTLLIYGCTNALLAWCEQAALFQWLGNLSFGAEPTFLESTPLNAVDFIASIFNEKNTFLSYIFFSLKIHLVDLSYLFAFFLGSIAGALFLGLFIQRFLEYILRYRKIAIYYGLVKQANLPLATLIFAFGFGSIPYYGLDYLVTKGFGFIPQETTFKQTLFSPINLISKNKSLSINGEDTSNSSFYDELNLFPPMDGEKTRSLVIDTAPFDDGQYVKRNQKRPQTFEDLNYRGEHLWTNRYPRTKDKGNQTQSSFLGPVFSWMRSRLWGDELISSKNDLTSGNLNPSLKASLKEKEEVFADTIPLEKNLEGLGKGAKSQAMSTTPEMEMSPEMEKVDTYLKQFDRQFDKGFSNYYHTNGQSLIDVPDQWQEKRIKEKCYKNPIYKFLLNTEIDAFMARQPNSHWLSSEEEMKIFKRRQLLSNYYDTLALTSQLSTSEALAKLVPKSYANAIYNHQFKGTLKIARRLFSLKKGDSLLKTDNPNPSLKNFSKNNLKEKAKEDGNLKSFPSTTLSTKNQVEKLKTLKFDQPLFAKKEKSIQGVLFHEELNELKVDNHVDNHAFTLDQDISSWNKTAPFENLADDHKVTKSGHRVAKDKEIDGKVKVYDYDDLIGDNENNSKKVKKESSTFSHKSQAKVDDYDNLIGDSFYNINDFNHSKENIFSLEQAESTPLYAGWDEEVRKFVLTNRYQNRALASYTVSHKEIISPSNQVFTIWPIPDPLSDKKYANALRKDEDIDSSNSFNKITETDSSTDSLSLEESKEKSNHDSFDEKKFNYTNENQFLFPSKPLTNDMVKAMLQWQKLIKEDNELSQEKEGASDHKNKASVGEIAFWPDNVRRAHWFIDNDMEFDQSTENLSKKKALLWEFTPPHHGGFFWPGKEGKE